MKRKHTWIWIAAAFLMVSGLATAQETDDEVLYGSGAAFARLVAAEGTVKVNRESDEELEGITNLSIEPLDTVTTQWDSRAVIQFLDGSLLKMNEGSRIDFLEIGTMADEPQLTLLARLWEGALFLDISDDATVKARSFRIDTEDATLYFLSGGRYRIDKVRGQTALKVISGTAEVHNNGGSTLYHAGEQAVAEAGYATVRKTYFNTFEMDAFDNWAMNHYTRRTSAGSEYVPAELQYYASDLDENGTWYYDDDLTTYVWRPNIVVADWTPYSNGYWAWSPYGMSWVSYYSWGWAPFHYGAWDWSIRFGWVWVPGRYYSPAWVSWCHWDHYMGWYPYNHRHWNHYYRGHLERRHHRHRIVYAQSDRLNHRNTRWATRDMPEGRDVVRVNRPIAPTRDKLVRSPREAVREAVDRPVTRETIRSRDTVVRERASQTVVRGSGTAGSDRGERVIRDSGTVRTPVIRNNESAGASSRSRTIEDRTVRPRIETRSSGSSGTVSSSGKIIRRTPVIRSQESPPSTASRNTVIRRSESGSAGSSVRSTTPTRNKTVVTPRSSSRSTVRPSTSSSRNAVTPPTSSRAPKPVVTSRKSTAQPTRSTTRSSTVTRSTKSTTSVKSSSSRSSTRSSSTRSTRSSNSSRSSTNSNRKR